MKYTVAKSKSNGLWWVLDEDGFEVSYIGYDFKKDALEAARVRRQEDREIAKGAVARR